MQKNQYSTYENLSKNFVKISLNFHMSNIVFSATKFLYAQNAGPFKRYIIKGGAGARRVYFSLRGSRASYHSVSRDT